MKGQLLPETEAGIRQLVKQVLVSKSLEREVHMELADHIRDKVCAYVSGEEPVTEADALVLARAHFGNAGIVTAMMRKAHKAAPAGWRAGFWRELAHATLVLVWGLSMTYAITALLYVPAVIFPAAWEALRMHEDLSVMPCAMVAVLTCLTVPLAFLWVNRWMKWLGRENRKGLDYWAGWSLWVLGGLALNVAAIGVYGWMCGEWSDGWNEGGVGRGIFLTLLPRDVMWLWGGSPSWNFVFWGVWIAGVGTMIGVFVKRVIGRDGRVKEALAATGAILGALILVRSVIAVMVLHEALAHGLVPIAGGDFMTQLWHQVVVLVTMSAMPEVGIGVLVLGAVGVWAWQRRAREERGSLVICD